MATLRHSIPFYSTRSRAIDLCVCPCRSYNSATTNSLHVARPLQSYTSFARVFSLFVFVCEPMQFG